MWFLCLLFAVVRRDTIAKTILEMLLKGKGKQARKRVGAEGRALSISARLCGLPQTEMEANNALKLLSFSAISPPGSDGLQRSVLEGQGFTAPNPCPGPP